MGFFSEAGFFFRSGGNPVGIEVEAGGLDWELASKAKPTDSTSGTKVSS